MRGRVVYTRLLTIFYQINKRKEVKLMVQRLEVNINKAYFNYLVRYVCDRKHHKVDYIPLLDTL